MKTILFNPFEKYSDRTLLIIGLVFSLIGVSLAFAFNARFDGFIDLHFVEKTAFYQPLSDLLINTCSGTLVFFIIGKLINQKTRWVDILSTCLIAKIPFYIVSFFNINNLTYNVTTRILAMADPQKISSISTADLFILMSLSIVMIPALIWVIVLMYNGFKIATNAKETKHIVFFILGIIIAEIISKLLIIIIK